MEQVDAVKHTQTHLVRRMHVCVCWMCVCVCVCVCCHHNRTVLRPRSPCEEEGYWMPEVRIMRISCKDNRRREEGGGDWYEWGTEEREAKYLQPSHDIPAAATNFLNRVWGGRGGSRSAHIHTHTHTHTHTPEQPCTTGDMQLDALFHRYNSAQDQKKKTSGSRGSSLEHLPSANTHSFMLNTWLRRQTGAAIRPNCLTLLTGASEILHILLLDPTDNPKPKECHRDTYLPSRAHGRK